MFSCNAEHLMNLKEISAKIKSKHMNLDVFEFYT